MARRAVPGSRLIDASGPRRVTEVRAAGAIPLWTHPEWSARFPWLVHGTTGRGEGEAPFDLGLHGALPAGEVIGRWRTLQQNTLATVVHARQIHGAAIAGWHLPVPSGIVLIEGFDAHLTDRPELLLTISVADCVPVFLVEARTRALALVHAGWRGIAQGIVEAAIVKLAPEGSRSQLWLHSGPSICAACYEVGPEVHRAILPGTEAPAHPQTIDLPGAIMERAQRLGIPAAQTTRSTHCTRCGEGRFFSHRAGSAARQLGILGRRG